MKTEKKIRILLALFSVSFIIVLARTAYWQIVRGESLAIEADNQHFYSLEIPANRGIIRSVDGFDLVANKESYTLYANLTELKQDPQLVSTELSPVLIDFNSLLATTSAEKDQFTAGVAKQLSLKNVVWVKMMSGLNIAAKDRISALKIDGLSFVPEQTRDYTESSMSAHLLGFVGEDNQGGNSTWVSTAIIPAIGFFWGEEL